MEGVISALFYLDHVIYRGGVHRSSPDVLLDRE